MRALLLANADDADAGFVGHHLHRQGYAFTELLREHPSEWPDGDGVDLALLLGSEWSVFWPQVAEYVEAEAAVVRRLHERGTPILAICYGSQLVAHALGGSVSRAPASEIGWVDVDSDEPAIADGPWLEWHSDVVTVPSGAVEIARNPVGPQAWRIARTLCTQFHPEATETMLARWSAGRGGQAELAEVGLTRHELRAQTSANVTVSRKHAEHLVDWFLAEIAGA